MELRQVCENLVKSYYYDFYQLYTDDGSKDKDGNSGVALFHPRKDYNIHLNIAQNVSIMSAELIAITETISYIKSCLSGKYVIMTDSKSTIDHLARYTSTFRCSSVAYVIIDDLYKLIDIHFIIT